MARRFAELGLRLVATKGTAEGIAALQGERLRVRPLQELTTVAILLEF